MAEVVRVAKVVSRIVSSFKCQECLHEFDYTSDGAFAGFPDYCPACGESFDTTTDAEVTS